MAQARYLPAKKNPYLFWSQIAASAVVLFPLTLQQRDFRATFAQGVSISAHKASPAYAAFEDLREKYTSEIPSIPDSGQLLVAGKSFDVKVALHQTSLRQIAMHGITIHRPVEPAAPTWVAEQEPSARGHAPSRPAPQLTTMDYKAYTVGELAQRLAIQELASSQAAMGPVAPEERVFRSSTGTPIVVRRSVETAAAPTPSPTVTRMPAWSTPPPTPIAAAAPPMAVSKSYGGGAIAALATVTPNPDNLRPLWLSGQVEMTGGLAFVGPETQMILRRTYNGQNFEQGRIWVSEGKFEIHVKEPTGFLVAELKTSDGRVLGRGEMNLLDLKNAPEKDNHISDVRIALHPTTEGVQFRTISGYSHDQQRIVVPDARVEIQAYSDPQKVSAEGIVSDPTLSRDSNFIARAQAKDHWSSLVVGQADVPQDIRLFAKPMVEALIGLSSSGTDKMEALHSGVVWGQVTKDGLPLAGATVEMAGDYQPIYFNQTFLPDSTLSGTSANGLFAFVRIQPGVQALRVNVEGKVYPAQIFPTEDRNVSYVEISVRQHAISEFRVFDGLNMGKPISASIRLLGSDQVLPVKAGDLIEYGVAANPFMVEADAGIEYELSRVAVSGTPHVVNVPLIQREWLAKLASDHGIAPLPRHGTVVGFMDEQDFEVELTGYPPGVPMQIVYFDARGYALESHTGVAGGGFAIFNAPQGLQTLYVHPTQSRETFSQIIVAEPEFVQVVTH